MFCENCGYKLNNAHLFCENCGNKIIPNNKTNNEKSNKTVWIILGCLFGGVFLIVFLGILFFGIGIVNYNLKVVETVDDYYKFDNSSKSYKTDEEYLDEFPEIKEVYKSTLDIYTDNVSYYTKQEILSNEINYNNLVLMAMNSLKDDGSVPVEVTLEQDFDVNNHTTYDVFENIDLPFFKVNDIYVKSVNKDIVNSKIKRLFNVDYRVEEVDSEYFYSICDGFTKYNEKKLSYRLYYQDCNSIDEFYTKIYDVQYSNEDIIVKEFVGYNMEDYIYEGYLEEYVSSIDTIKYYYDELKKYEKTFKKNANGEYYFYRVRQI